MREMIVELEERERLTLETRPVPAPVRESGSSGLVVHTARPLDQLDSVQLTKWSPELVAWLLTWGVTSPTPVQRALWPAVTGLRSCLAVARPGKGTTLGWLLPLLNSLACPEQYSALPPGHSPLCVVVCPGVRVAEHVAATARDISSRAGLGVRVLLDCTGLPSPAPAHLLNGCEMMVVSPRRLLDLLHNSRLMTLDRCCHLVLEEAAVCLDRSPADTATLLTEWKRARAGARTAQDQLVMVSHRWSPALRHLAQKALLHKFRPTVVLADLLEAAIYGQVEMVPAWCPGKQERLACLQSVVDSREDSRLVICCGEGAAEVEATLAVMGQAALLLDQTGDRAELQAQLEHWEAGPGRTALLVPDTTLLGLELAGAERATSLVHWDLPGRAAFTRRFQFIKSGVTSLMTGCPAQPAVVHLLLGPQDEPSLGLQGYQPLLQLLARARVEAPPQLEERHHALLVARAGQALSAGLPLCPALAARGRCEEVQNGGCGARHFLHVKLDHNSHLPSPGSTFTFHLIRLERPEVGWARPQPATDHTTMLLKMASHFANPNNRIQAASVEQGKLVAAAGEDGVYKVTLLCCHFAASLSIVTNCPTES